MQASTIEIPFELIWLLRGTLRRGSASLVALTGAEVSKESGLRTFRDAQTGLWSQYKPEELASPQAFARDPKLIWDWYAWRREAVKGVRPKPRSLCAGRNGKAGSRIYLDHPERRRSA